MDLHLPKIQDPAFSFPQVPYYGIDELKYTGPDQSKGERLRQWASKQAMYLGPRNSQWYKRRLTDWTLKQVKESRPLQFYSDQLIGRASAEDTQERYSAFIREWLFFGLLQEFFQACDLPFSREDFVRTQDGVRFITTEALKDYILALVVQEELRQQDGTATQRGINLEDNDGVDRYGLKKTMQVSNDKSRGRMIACHEVIKIARDSLAEDVTPKLGLLYPPVWDSVLLLAASLSRVVDSILRPLAFNYEEWYYPVDFRQFGFRSIPDIRTNEAWCCYERKLIENLVDGRLHEIAFFSRIKRKEASGLHSTCTDRQCVAYQVTNDYCIQHAGRDCQCELLDVDSQTVIAPKSRHLEYVNDVKMLAGRMASSSIGQAVGADKNYHALTKKITAVVFKDNQIQPVTVPIGIPAKLKRLGSIPAVRDLVAISHVWSDGLGNPTGNKLPACQMARLQHLVNQLFKDQSLHPVPFWIDTLMIPLIPKDASEQARERKRNALSEMEWVYKNASKVLVLDKGLLALKITNLTREELGAQIMCSTWTRRLWTLQEGCVAEKTFFQLADGPVSHTNLHNDILKLSTVPDLIHATVLPEKHPIRKKQTLPWLDIHRRGFTQGLDTNLWDILNVLESRIVFGVGAFYGGFIGGALAMYFDVSSPRFQSARRLAKRLFKVVNPVWYTIFRFFEEMSLLEATLLQRSSDLTGGVLTRCMRAMYYRNCTKPADESLVLASLLSSTPGLAAELTTVDIPRRMQTLFQKLERVPIELLFIDQRRYETPGGRWIPQSLLGVNAPDSKPISRTEKIRTKKFILSRKRSLLSTVTSEGLEIGLDGLRIHPQPCALTAPFRFRFKEAYYHVKVRQPGTAEEITLLQEAQWVLIPELSFISLPMRCEAALVKVTNWYPLRPGGIAEFSALASINRIKPADFERMTLPCLDLRLHEKQKVLTERLKTDLSQAVQKISVEMIKPDDKWIVG